MTSTPCGTANSNMEGFIKAWLGTTEVASESMKTYCYDSSNSVFRQLLPPAGAGHRNTTMLENQWNSNIIGGIVFSTPRTWDDVLTSFKSQIVGQKLTISANTWDFSLGQTPPIEAASSRAPHYPQMPHFDDLELKKWKDEKCFLVNKHFAAIHYLAKCKV